MAHATGLPAWAVPSSRSPSLTSAVARTLTPAVARSLPGFGSRSPPATVAAFAIGPAGASAATVARMVTRTQLAGGQRPQRALHAHVARALLGVGGAHGETGRRRIVDHDGGRGGGPVVGDLEHVRHVLARSRLVGLCGLRHGEVGRRLGVGAVDCLVVGGDRSRRLRPRSRCSRAGARRRSRRRPARRCPDTRRRAPARPHECNPPRRPRTAQRPARALRRRCRGAGGQRVVDAHLTVGRPVTGIAHRDDVSARSAGAERAVVALGDGEVRRHGHQVRDVRLRLEREPEGLGQEVGACRVVDLRCPTAFRRARARGSATVNVSPGARRPPATAPAPWPRRMTTCSAGASSSALVGVRRLGAAVRHTASQLLQRPGDQRRGAGQRVGELEAQRRVLTVVSPDDRVLELVARLDLTAVDVAHGLLDHDIGRVDVDGHEDHPRQVGVAAGLELQSRARGPVAHDPRGVEDVGVEAQLVVVGGRATRLGRAAMRDRGVEGVGRGVPGVGQRRGIERRAVASQRSIAFVGHLTERRVDRAAVRSLEALDHDLPRCVAAVDRDEAVEEREVAGGRRAVAIGDDERPAGVPILARPRLDVGHRVVARARGAHQRRDVGETLVGVLLRGRGAAVDGGRRDRAVSRRSPAWPAAPVRAPRGRAPRRHRCQRPCSHPSTARRRGPSPPTAGAAPRDSSRTSSRPRRRRRSPS